MRALRYIAREEDFQAALTKATCLRVKAIHSDGSIVSTYLVSPIIHVRRSMGNFAIMIEGGKSEIELYLI